MGLGVKFVNVETLKELCTVAIGFVDDGDLVEDGMHANVDVQELLNVCNCMHVATGGHIEEAKTKYYAWKHRWKQGEKVLKRIPTELWLNGKKLVELDFNESQRTLGVCINPALTWTKQFEIMKEKMCVAMSKLRSTPLSIGNACVFFNVCLITQVFFGCGIIILNDKQEEILMKIMECTLLKKLGLSERFPRKILYSLKSQLGVGIMKPSTIIAMLALKLYAGHKRQEDVVSKKMVINERNIAWQHGYSKGILEISRDHKPKKVMWSDDVSCMMQKRDIKIVNVDKIEGVDARNETIMDLVVKYVKTKELDSEVISALNYIRLYKKMCLPCELVGLKGRSKMKQHHCENEPSCLRWKTQFPSVPKPSKKSFEV